MEYIRLGKSNLLVSHVAFGSMRLTEEGSDDAAILVRKAYEEGINFFDTSHKTPASEKLLGDALFDIRKNVTLSTTTNSMSSNEIINDLEDSLMTLHCDTVDLYQYETDKFVPMAGGADKIYDTLLQLKEQGKIGHIGLVTKDYETAVKAIQSGLYETIQYPFSVVTPENDFTIVKMCEEKDVGFIAMQPLGGGIIQNIPLAIGFLHQFENVIPIWGATTQEEMDQILYFNSHPPVIDEQFKVDVEKMRNFFN